MDNDMNFDGKHEMVSITISQDGHFEWLEEVDLKAIIDDCDDAIVYLLSIATSARNELNQREQTDGKQ